MYAEKGPMPDGVPAIGTALPDCGSNKTPVVPQQWNRHFRPPQTGKSGLSNSENQESRL